MVSCSPYGPILPRLMSEVSDCGLFRNTFLVRPGRTAGHSPPSTVFLLLLGEHVQASADLDDVPGLPGDELDFRPVQRHQSVDAVPGGQLVDRGLPGAYLGEVVEQGVHVRVRADVELTEGHQQVAGARIDVGQVQVGAEGVTVFGQALLDLRGGDLTRAVARAVRGQPALQTRQPLGDLRGTPSSVREALATECRPLA